MWRSYVGLTGLFLFMAGPANASPPSAARMCEAIRHDITDYLATGHPCPCPYSLMRNGTACGNRAAWAKPDGKMPRCYFPDVDGTLPPNRRPHPARQQWPDPPTCGSTG
jgi:hypothetical protein